MSQRDTAPLRDGPNARAPREEGAGCAFLCGDLELVGPPAVVGHRLAAEDAGVERLAITARVGDRRIVHQDDDRLALHVDALEVVPLELGRFHREAGEDDLGILDGDLGLLHAGIADELVPPANRELAAGRRAKSPRRRVLHRHAHQRNGLLPASAEAAGLETDLLQALREVRPRHTVSRASRTPSTHRVVRQRARVAHQAFGGDP
jgi:hypothetical protein